MFKVHHNNLCMLIVFIITSIVLIFHGWLDSRYNNARIAANSVGFRVTMKIVEGKTKAEKLPRLVPDFKNNIYENTTDLIECEKLPDKKYILDNKITKCLNIIPSDTEFYKIYFKYNPNCNYDDVEKAKFDSTIKLFWGFKFIDSFLSTEGAWHLPYQVLLLILRLLWFISTFNFILPVFIRFMKSIQEMLEPLGNVINVAKATKDGTALIAKTVLIGGATLTLAGGTIAAVVTLKAPVLKLYSDPVNGVIHHVIDMPTDKIPIFQTYTSKLRIRFENNPYINGNLDVTNKNDGQKLKNSPNYFIIIDKDVKGIYETSILNGLNEVNESINKLNSIVKTQR